MTTALFTVCLVFIAIALAVQLAGQLGSRTLRPAPPAYVLIAACATITFGFFAPRLSEADRGVRLTAESLHFASGPERVIEFTAGGDPARDELYVRRVSTGVATPVAGGLVGLNAAEAGFEVTVRHARDAPIAAAVQINDDIVDARRFARGDAVCLRSCERAGAVWLTYDPRRNALVAGNEAGPVMERREKRLGIGRDDGPSARLYPLRHYAPPPPEAAPRARDGAAASRPPPDPRAGLNSFLFRDRETGALHIALLDDSVRVRTRGGELIGPRDQRAPVFVLCAQGPCAPLAKIRIFEIRFGEPPVGAGAAETAQRGLLSEMRSFDARAEADGGLTIRLDTPDQIRLQDAEVRAELDKLRRTGNEPSLRIAAGVQARASAETAYSTVGFEALGGALQRAIDHRLIFDGADLAIAHGPHLITAPSGAHVRMGDEVSALVRVEKLDHTWPALSMAQYVILLGGLVSLVALWRVRASSPIAFAVFAILDLLLTLRVLIGVEAAFVDGGVEARDAPVQAFAAFFTAPLLLSLLARETYQTPFRLAAHALFVAAAMFWLDRDVGGLGPFLFVGAGAVAVALVCAALGVLGRLKLPALPPSDELVRNLDLKAVVALVAIAFLLRLALVAAGVRESTMIGGLRISVSIFYVPITILLFAKLFALWEEGGRDRSGPHLAGFAAAFLLLCIVPLALANDTGAFIYALPFALFGYILAFEQAQSDTPAKRFRARLLLFGGAALAAVGLLALAVAPNPVGAEGFLAHLIGRIVENLGATAIALVGVGLLVALAPLRLRTLMGAPAAFIFAVIAVVNIAPLLPAASESRIERALATEDIADDLAILDDAQRYGSSNLRIISLVKRETLAEIGTREAEGQAIALAHMADHGRRFWGPGYLNAEPPAPAGLLRYHMNDNVTVVHVMAPFGRFNAALLVFTMFLALALVAAAAARLKDPDAPRGFSYFAGVLSFATLTLVSAYMYMGNLEAAPFTGRNAYLLAVNSIGDVVEALALMGMTLFFLRTPREAEAEQRL